MKSLFNFFILFVLIHITITGQTVIRVDQQGMPKLARLKDTIIYKIITQTKDTFDFGIDKKIKFQDPQSVISNTVKINNKFVDIKCYGNGTLIMSINLETIKKWKDTVAVYHLLDPTFITRFVIIKTLNCEIKSFHVNSYDKVKQYAYSRQLLNKLLKSRDD